jgi:hypothetical protein
MYQFRTTEGEPLTHFKSVVVELFHFANSAFILFPPGDNHGYEKLSTLMNLNDTVGHMVFSWISA